MLLFYVRHGDPIYDPDSLTPLGTRQAEAVGKRIAAHGIDKIFASTSNRAYLTSLPLAEISKKDVTRIDFLNEGHAWEYFALPNKTGNRQWVFAQQHDFRKLFVKNEIYKLGDQWYQFPDFQQYPFQEGVEYYHRNTDEFMHALGYVHDRTNHSYKAMKENNERVAVFAHEGVGSIFLSSLLDIPYPLFAAHYAMSHTNMTVISFDSTGDEIIPKVLQFSNDSHLYKDGLPTFYYNNIPI